MHAKVLSEREIEDLIFAAKILGCGGGGEAIWARPMIDEVMAKDKKFRIVSPTEIPPDEMTMIVGTVGGGVPREILEKVSKLRKTEEKPEFVAVRELSSHIGKEPYAFLASEIGASNTIVPMYVAAMTDRVAVDADCCGRAKPEIAISTTHVANLPITPLSIVTPFGEKMILKEAVDDYRAEDICRAMALISGGRAGVARCPARGERVTDGIVPGSISRCIRIGDEVRSAGERGKNLVDALVASTNGIRLFTGRVRSFTREEKGAFTQGEILLEGTESDAGNRLRVWYKNEYLVTWKNQKPYATCPDSICIVDLKTATGLSVWGDDFVRGREVVAFGIKAADLWRTERGLTIFGPRHFGFDMLYKPVETLESDAIDL